MKYGKVSCDFYKYFIFIMIFVLVISNIKKKPWQPSRHESNKTYGDNTGNIRVLPKYYIYIYK